MFLHVTLQIFFHNFFNLQFLLKLYVMLHKLATCNVNTLSTVGLGFELRLIKSDSSEYVCALEGS